MKLHLAAARYASIALLMACASAGTSPSRHAPDLITADEIATASAPNAWDLISRLRPMWLKPQNIGSIGGGAYSQVVAVYMDGIRLGDTSLLRTLSTSGVKSIQWLDATRAATVLSSGGSDPVAGAIVIKTK